MKRNNEIETLKKVVNHHHLLKKYQLKKIGVFGSVARGEKSNDIDLFVENVSDYKNLLDFREELEKLLQKKVDIVIDKYANPIVLYRAKKEMLYVTES